VQTGGVESAIRKYGSRDVNWSSQGMLRLSTESMRRLFQPTLERIKQAIGDVLNHPNARGTYRCQYWCGSAELLGGSLCSGCFDRRSSTAALCFVRCSGAGMRRNAVPANIFELERRSGKYCLSQPER